MTEGERAIVQRLDALLVLIARAVGESVHVSGFPLLRETQRPGAAPSDEENT